MISIVARIRVRKEFTDAMAEALADVVTYVEDNEPGTVSYFVCQCETEPGLFFTYERYDSRDAMDIHNSSDAIAAWIAKAQPMLIGGVEVHTCDEIAAMKR